MEEYNLAPCADEIQVGDAVYGVRSSSQVMTVIGKVIKIDPSTHLYRIRFDQETFYADPAEVGKLKVAKSKGRVFEQWIDRPGLHHFGPCPTPGSRPAPSSRKALLKSRF